LRRRPLSICRDFIVGGCGAVLKAEAGCSGPLLAAALNSRQLESGLLTLAKKKVLRKLRAPILKAAVTAFGVV